MKPIKEQSAVLQDNQKRRKEEENEAEDKVKAVTRTLLYILQKMMYVGLHF